MKIGYE